MDLKGYLLRAERSNSAKPATGVELVLAGDFHPCRDNLTEADVPHYLESFGAAEMPCRGCRQ